MVEKGRKKLIKNSFIVSFNCRPITRIYQERGPLLITVNYQKPKIKEEIGNNVNKQAQKIQKTDIEHTAERKGKVPDKLSG